MEEKEESFIKETERGREVYCELHRIIHEYNNGVYGYGKASPMVEFIVAVVEFYWCIWYILYIILCLGE